MRKSGAQVPLFALLLGGVLAAGCSSDPSTPEQKQAKAEALLKAMSATLAAAPSLSVETTEAVDRVRPGGDKVTETSTRTTSVRRPDAAHFRVTSDRRDTEAWYDGKKLTLAMHKDKAWARGPMPATLDAALDFLATEYDIRMPTADLFYSNPYESFEATQSKGGWVGRETIDGAVCHHLAFEAPIVNWEIWLADTPQALPCRLKIVYRQDEGAPQSVITFKNWNLAPTLAADAFTAKVAEGYERLYMVRAPTAEPEAVAEAAPQEPAAAGAAGKQ
jgi:hypothetical protein